MVREMKGLRMSVVSKSLLVVVSILLMNGLLAAADGPASFSRVINVYTNQRITLTDADENVKVNIFGSPEVFIYLSGGEDNLVVNCYAGSPKLSVTGGCGNDTLSVSYFLCFGTALIDTDNGFGQAVSVVNFFSGMFSDVYVTPNDLTPFTPSGFWYFSPTAKTKVTRGVPAGEC